MSASPRPDAGGTSDRVRCAYCGANNFPTSPTCWQCGRPLRPLSVNAPAGMAAAPPGPGGPPATAAWLPATGASGFDTVDQRLAPKAAAALGLLLPWAGLPIGIAFLMLDDPRKVKLGWIAIGWSIAGTVLNTLLFVVPLLGLWPFIKSALTHQGGGVPGGAGGSGMPTLPSLGGAGLLALHVRLLFYVLIP